MDLFLGCKVEELDKNFKNTIVDLKKEFNYKLVINTLYFCYINEIPCMIIKNEVPIKTDFKHGVNIVTDNRNLFFTWNYVKKINSFICKKYQMNEPFYQEETNIYIIFFLEFINKNYSLLSTDKGTKLLGFTDSYFGIFDSYRELIHNVTHGLYFSFGLQKFLLYKVVDKSQYVCGKLFNDFTIDRNFLTTEDKKYPIPDSFVNIKGKIYAIRKKIIKIEVVDETKLIDNCVNYQDYQQFCCKNQCENIYVLEIYFKLNLHVLRKLHKFITLRFPILDNENNFVFVDPDNYKSIVSHFSMYLFNNKNRQFLAIHFNQFLYQYLNCVIDSIGIFLDRLQNSYTIKTNQYKILYNRQDKKIHLISELVFLVVVIIYKMPFIMNNVKVIDDSPYTQLNYRFNIDEIKKLKNNSKNTEYKNYIIDIILSALSVFMNNYYVIIHSENIIDVVPIFNGISNNEINSFISRSNKANLSKTFLISYLFKLFNNVKKEIEIPVIILNIVKIKFTNKMTIDKIYGKNLTKNIPIFINVVYSNSSLVISITYKDTYKQIKYIFNEIIDSIIK